MENVTRLITPNRLMGMQLDEKVVNTPVTFNGMPVGFISGVDENFIHINIFNRGLIVELSETGDIIQVGLRYDFIGEDI